MIPKDHLNEEEFDELEEFLLYEKTPDGCMDISTLDGFLTCLIIGPDTIMPSRWLPAVWGETPSDEMIWDSRKESEHYIGLLMSYYNSISQEFQNNLYEPLFYISKINGKEYTIIDEWCWGFMTAVNMASDSWRPLFQSKENKSLMTPIVLHGTTDGHRKLKEDTEYSTVPHEEWVKSASLSAIGITKFWLPYRKSVVQATHQAISNSVGRNDPCPCGSGKKYKKCCMN